MSLRLVKPDDNYDYGYDQPEEEPAPPPPSARWLSWFIGFCLGVVLVAVML